MAGGVTFRRVAAASIMVTLAGCAHHYVGNTETDPYGFFSGIWHGIVFPFAICVNLVSWVLSLFGSSFLQSIEIIGRPNTGVFYYFGFILGLGAWSGSAS